MSSYLFEPPFARSRAIALEAAMKEADAVVEAEPPVPANVEEALKQLKPKAAKPIVEEPIVEEPIVEEPLVEEPIVEEPLIEEPLIEEPVAEEPDQGWDATMLKPALLAIAEERGLDLPEKPKKSDIIKALEEQA